MEYVMSDIHGQYEKYMGMLEQIKFSKSDKMYIIGDIMDRGNGIIELIKDIWSRDNVEVLLGNNEVMAIDSLKEHKVNRFWKYNGGERTFNDIVSAGDKFYNNVIGWLSKLPYYKILEDKKVVLMHGGLDRNSIGASSLEDACIKCCKDCEILWSRPESDWFNKELYGYTAICGHTPTELIIGAPNIVNIVKKNTYIIDCGAFHSSGRLGCLRLDDYAEFYI